jgi:hypothetical protein
MTKQSVAVVFLAAMVLGAVGCKEQPMPEFKKFESPAGKFSVLLPGTPKESTKSVPTPVGPLPILMYLTEVSRGRGFNIGVTTLPPGTPFDYNGAVNGAASNVKGTVASSNETTIDGKKGREGLIKLPNGQMLRMKIVVANDRAYQLQAIGDDAFVKSDDANKFFDSIKIVP